MQFVPFAPDVEVNGQTVWSVVAAFAFDRRIPSRFLVEQGIGSLGADDLVQLAPDGWYSQAAWLRAFQKISEHIGANVLFAIGKRIPENAQFPDWAKDIETGIRSIDVAYHLNHRRQGRPLFEPETGSMREGIGHYGFEQVGARRVRSRCENPYPCDFDLGILTAIARRFERTSYVAHLDEQQCRKHGAEACTYEVTW